MRRVLSVVLAVVFLSSCSDLAPRWESPGTGAVLAGRTPTPAPPPSGHANVKPVMGGSLLVTTGDNLLVTSPAREAVYFVTTQSSRVERLQLPEGSMPTRAVELSPSTFLVLLRGAGRAALVHHDLALRLGEVFDVCGDPRSVTLAPAGSTALVACGTGELVTVGASGVLAREFVAPDLRDVVFLDGQPWVSTFRSPSLRAVGAGASWRPSDATLISVLQREPVPVERTFSPTVAWRTVASGPGTAVMVHQRAAISSVALGAHVDGGAPGSAYGDGDKLPCVSGDSVVHSVVTRFTAAGVVEERGLPLTVLPVDIAVAPDGATFAVASAGTGMVVEFPTVGPPQPPGGFCTPDMPRTTPAPQVTGVGYLSTSALVFHAMGVESVFVQSRSGIVRRFELEPGLAPPFHTGQQLFHEAQPAGLACASCHPEAGDDGHTFVFDGQPVRTQSLLGGLLATAPFHWKGEHHDMTALLGDTMVQRMGAPLPRPVDVQLLDEWLDARPAPIAVGSRTPSAQGRAAFEKAGCASCHAGERLTNNATVDVGTGGAFQVPSLTGLSRRGPWMHTGCATSLRQRFDVACGGASHGDVSVLSAGELDDLVAYLEAL